MRDFLSWLLSPSGGPVQPGVLGFLDGIKRRPLVAHPVGAALVVLLFVHVAGFEPGAGVLAAVLAEAVNQWYKAVRGVYGNSMWFNVFARLWLAAVGAGITALQ